METLDKSAHRFAEFLKLKRETKKVSVKDLAKRAGLSHTFIYNIQDKVNQPSISSASRLLDALGETWDSFADFIKDREAA